ncbi:MAG: hypothetical protein QW197_01525 [Candidatus Aenigmatarchaeota archaeon]
MRLQNILDQTISISIFVATVFIVIFLSTSLYLDILDSYRTYVQNIRALALSNQIIYSNSSYEINNDIGLNKGKFNELDNNKVVSFFSQCNNNKDKLKEILVARDFKISLSSGNTFYSCFTSNVRAVKRVVTFNNNIEIFEIGIMI